MLTNADGAKNRKLVMRATPSFLGDIEEVQEEWVDVRPYDGRQQLDEIIPFKKHLAIFGYYFLTFLLSIIYLIGGRGVSASCG